MEKHQNKLTTKFRVLWLALFIVWFVLSNGFAYWIPFPWSLFPILGTLTPLIVGAIILKKYSKGKYDESITLAREKLKQVKSTGVPDLEKILKKQSTKEEPIQEKETGTYVHQSVIKENKTYSIEQRETINDGSKRKKDRSKRKKDSSKRKKFKSKY
jgi:hypothetical protein